MSDEPKFSRHINLCIGASIASVIMNLALGIYIAAGGASDTFAALASTDISVIKAKQDAVSNSVMKSWESQPFIDVKVIDTTEYQIGCPDSHPEELIYGIW